MFPFFETIRYKNGVLENSSFHQQRVDRTFMHFNAALNKTRKSINDINCFQIKSIQIPNHLLPNQVYKCRVKYNFKGDVETEFQPYQVRKINSLSIVDIEGNEYAFKYTNREWLNNLLNKVQTDEVILFDKQIVKDASYANLAFFDGIDWFTPKSPLLLGTRRAALIEKGIIIEKEITLLNLNSFKKVKFINAMMLWEESPTLDFTFDSNTNTLALL